MIKRLLTSFALLSPLLIFAQTEIDLGVEKHPERKISAARTREIVLVNAIPGKIYKIETTITSKPISPFTMPGDGGGVSLAPSSSLKDAKVCPTGPAIVVQINSVLKGTTEMEIKKTYEEVKAEIAKLADPCKAEAEALLKDIEPKRRQSGFIRNIGKNQKIIVSVLRYDASETTVEKTWEVTLETEEGESRWLTHFGLTYAPSIIVRSARYYTQADTSVANRYTITKQKNNSQRPWDNISATVNFTYPFSAKPRGLDLGFTGGFGLNPDFQLSGHAGLSAIVGTNIIVGTGIVFMQKYNLKGEYSNGQIIKENLSFASLHEKVWKPEVFVTLGFRFNKNPFAGTSEKKGETEKSKDEKKD